MLVNERHDKILNILKERKSATVNYLASVLYISKSTIRRDLATLQSKGFIKHEYGGAILVDEASYTLPIEFRTLKAKSEKRNIGKEAALLVEDGDVIFLDSSSTVLYMIEHLRSKNSIIAVTNNFRALEMLNTLENIKVYSTGGVFSQNSMSYTGRFALATIERISIDKMFFSPTGISSNGLLLECGEQENLIRCAALSRSAKKICLCDHSKLNKNYLFEICSITDIDYIISDTDIFATINITDKNKPILLISK